MIMRRGEDSDSYDYDDDYDDINKKYSNIIITIIVISAIITATAETMFVCWLVA